MKARFFIYVALLFSLSDLYAQDTLKQKNAPKVDIFSESFTVLVDSLTSNSMTGQLYEVMYAAGEQAEKAENVRLAAIYYDKAAGYAQDIGNKEAMVDAFIKSSTANRKRNFAGTSIRQLAAAEQAVSDNEELLYKVNEAQWTNFEALGDIANAYKYYRKVAEYKERLMQKRIDEAVATVKSTPDIKQTDNTIEKKRRNRDEKKSLSISTVTDHSGLVIQLIIPYVLLLFLIIALIIVIRSSCRKRRAFEKRCNEMLLSIPDKLIEDALKVLNVADSVMSFKDRENDKFKATLDKTLGVLYDMSFNVADFGFSSIVMRDSYVVDMTENDADRLLKESKKRFEYYAMLRNISIDYKSTGRCDVVCDSKSVETVINMLIYDSLNNTMVGGRISLWIESDGNSVTLAVEDEGNKDRLVIVEMQPESSDQTQFKIDSDIRYDVFVKVSKLNNAKFFTESKKNGGNIAGMRFSVK